MNGFSTRIPLLASVIAGGGDEDPAALELTDPVVVYHVVMGVLLYAAALRPEGLAFIKGGTHCGTAKDFVAE